MPASALRLDHLPPRFRHHRGGEALELLIGGNQCAAQYLAGLEQGLVGIAVEPHLTLLLKRIYAFFRYGFWKMLKQNTSICCPWPVVFQGVNLAAPGAGDR